MAIAKLSIDIEARLANLQAGLDKAGLLAERTANQISGAFSGLKSVAATVGPALAGVFAVAGIAGFVRQTLDGIDALNDLSDATGASIENLSALEDAAARTGTQMDTVGAALVKLNQQLAAAKPGNETDQALRAIGLSAEELRRIDPAQALLQVAQSLQQFEDDGNKARLVQELFGKSVREVAPLLKDLAESGQLNATVTREQADQVDRFNKELARLGKTATDVARDISGPLITAINNLLERGRKEGFLSALFTPTETGRAIQQAEDLSRAITVVTDRLLRAETLAKNLELPGAVRAKWAADAAALRKQLEGLQRQALDVTQGLKGPLPDEYGNEGRNRPRASLPTISAAPKPARVAGLDRAPDTYADVIGRGVAALIEKTDTVKLAELNAQLAKLEELAAAGLDPKIVEQVRSLLIPVDKGDVGPPISAELEKVNALLAQTDSRKLAEAQRTISLLGEELARVDPGTQRFYELQDAILAAQEELTALAGTFPDLSKAAEKEGKKIADELGFAFSSAFADAVVRAESLKDVLSGLAQDISRILTRELVTEPLAKAAVDWVKSVNWGGLIAGIFGGVASANGNAFTAAGIQRFANGGVVTAPTLFRYGGNRLGVMGEAGAEGVLPLRRGADGKLGVIAQGGGAMSVTVTNHFNLQGQMDRRTQAQIATDVGRSVQIAMRRNA